MIRRLLPLLLSILLSSPLWAETVSVVPCEDPALPEPGLTALLADGVMDGLFDEGFIATSAPAQSLSLQPWRELRPDFEAARSGGVDFCLEIFVSYSRPAGSHEGNPDAALPAEVEYRLYSVSEASLRAAGILKIPAADSLGSDDMNKMMRELGRSAVRASISVLAGKSAAAPLSARSTVSMFPEGNCE